MFAIAASLPEAGSLMLPPDETQAADAASARQSHAVRSVFMNSSSDHTVTQTHPLSVSHAARELAARGRDVVAARPANRRNQARVSQRLPKRVERRLLRAAKLGLRKRIEGNQIELRRPVAQQLYELARLGDRIVDAVEHDVLERDAAARLPFGVLPTRVEQLGDRVHLVNRHQLVAQ